MLFLYWQMPRHRLPLWFEHATNNLLNTISSRLHHLLHNTVLEYWLLDPRGQSYTFFLSVLVGAVIWMSVLSVSIRRREGGVLREKMGGEEEGGGEEEEEEEGEGNEETQQVQQPMNAHFAQPSDISTRGKHQASPTINTPSPHSKKNFSALADEAPVTYATLMENGMLDEDGSPTKKYKLLRLLEGDRMKDHVDRERRDR